MWVPKSAAHIRGRCLFQAWHLLEEIQYGVQQIEFFVILNRFLPFYPPMDPENQNF